MRASQAVSRIPSLSRVRASFGIASLSAVHLLIILHLGITLFLAYSLNIWVDEAFTLHTTGKGLTHAFYQALHFELQPPLYFVLLSLWRKFNSAIFFARLPSVLCIALTIKVVADLSRRFIEEVNPAWVIACVASSPFMIWAAVEMRVYAFVILLSGLLLRFFYDGFLEEHPRSNSRWWYVLVSILALYTQYYLGFLLVANACALLLLRRWRSLAVYLAAMGIVAICFAPMLNIVLYQVSTHMPRDNVTVSVLHSARSVSWIAKDYLLPVGWVQFYFLRRWLLRLGYVALLVLVMRKYRERITGNKIAIWTIALTLTLCLIVVHRLTGEFIVQERHAAMLFLPITLAAFSFISVVAHRKLVWGWVFLVLMFNGTTLYTRYAAMAKSGDWIRVAAYISTYEKPGQPVLVFQAQGVLSLAQYYEGLNLLVPIPNETGFEFVAPNRRVDEKQIAEAVKHVSDSREAWLVTDWTPDSSGDGIDDPILEEFIKRNYTVEKETRFYGSKVFLLRLKPLPRKTLPS